MPLFDYRCDTCHATTEHYVPNGLQVCPCETCGGLTERLISAPQRPRVPDMGVLNTRRQRIKEPVWRYPDGHRETLNSRNTRPEE